MPGPKRTVTKSGMVKLVIELTLEEADILYHDLGRLQETAEAGSRRWYAHRKIREDIEKVRPKIDLLP